MIEGITSLFFQDLAVDMGTSCTRIDARGRGMVCREPSIIAMRDAGGGARTAVAWGTEAKAMLGRTPGDIHALRPLREGVISDFAGAEELLRRFMRMVQGRRLPWGCRVALCIPHGTTEVERRAARKCAEAAGARQVWLVEQPLAAALGADLALASPEGNMIVDVGGGKTQVAVISLGGIVSCRTRFVGGDQMDEAVKRYMQERHGMVLGPRTAEDLKVRLGSATEPTGKETLAVKGRDNSRGVPRTVDVEPRQVWEALKSPVEEIIATITSTLEDTPPELASDIVDKGIVLTGGGALLRGLDEAIRRRTGLPVVVTEDPSTTVVMGAAKILASRSSLGGLLS